MRVLGIETSTLQGGVAIVDDRRVVCELLLSVELTHSERLLPSIDRVLADAGTALAGLDGLAVSLGPGSFTGLRIGLSTVKGLAYATGLPVVGVPTLEAMAWLLPEARWPICPVLDARKQEVYAALFRHEGGALVRLVEDGALSPERLCDWIEGPTLFIGDGVAAYGDLWRRRLGERMLCPPVFARAARPAIVAGLGRTRLLRGERDDPDRLVPRYLRPSEAEVRRRAAGAAPAAGAQGR
jgi:tRNA threonylcarbamoyladenosine biosynthesis protein TsaB